MEKCCETCRFVEYHEDDDYYSCSNFLSECWGQEVRLGEKCLDYRNKESRQKWRKSTKTQE